MKTTLGMRAALLGSGAALALIASPAFAGQLDDLKAQIDQLQSQLDQLEQQKAATAPVADTSAPVTDPTASDDQSKKSRVTKAGIDAITPGVADAVVGGDIPRSFKLPGSDTSMSIKTLIKADFIYDFDQSLGDSAGWPFATKKGVVQGDGQSQNRTNQFRFESRFSRLTFETRTPTDYGPLTTFIDADFWGAAEGPGALAGSGGFGNAFVTNSYLFELRDAFATLGPILVGQFISNTVDGEAFGEVLDHFGPPGEFVTVQAQVRYTQNWGKWTGSVSAENPQSDYTASMTSHGGTLAATGGGCFLAGTYGSCNSFDQVPDLTAAINYSDSWGHLKLAGLLRHIGFNSGIAGGAGTVASPFYGKIDEGTWGGGGILSGHVNLGSIAPFFGNDTFGGQGYYGTGIGRYVVFAGGLYNSAILKINTNAAGTVVTSTHLEPQPDWGGFLWYQHNWTDTLRSTLDFGYGSSHVSASTVPSETLQADAVWAGYANLLWSPLKQTTFGLEFMWGHKDFRRIGIGGPGGDVDLRRLMAEMIFSF